jgi:hypothetical protein
VLSNCSDVRYQVSYNGDLCQGEQCQLSAKITKLTGGSDTESRVKTDPEGAL